ncbi:MAG: sulfite exporter TauE/SafE family protein, partial [Roseiflexaceae bacterium]|nr:sulfite exporter TauE/SafE family protein [Roseiflexaceae bacterium]
MLEPWQWALVALGAFIVGLSKTGIAGIGILPVAIFASVLPARESVGILLFVLIAADIVAAALYRREADWPQLLRLFPWAAAGVVIGTFILGRVDDTTIRRMIGATLLLLVALVLLRRRGQRRDATVRPWA